MRSPLLSVLTRAPGIPAASAVMPNAVRSVCADTSPSVALAFAVACRGLVVAGAGSRAPRRGHVALVGVGGEHAGEQPHRRDTVDQRVVGLGVHRDPAVAQALDDRGLPQRSLPGEPGAVQARAQLEQLADAAGLGQRAVPHVVLDVELVVGLPHQLAGRARRAVRVLEEERGDLLDVAHLLVHLADVVAPRTLRLLEQLQAPDVHGHVAVLGEQESGRGGIDRVDHGCPPGGSGPILAPARPSHKRCTEDPGGSGSRGAPQ